MDLGLRKNKMILNLIHRPEMVPEYAETLMAHDAKGNAKNGAILQESLDIFRVQQEIAHKNGIKTFVKLRKVEEYGLTDGTLLMVSLKSGKGGKQ